MSRILITGADGFIGKNLAKKLNSKNHKIYKIGKKSGDICKSATFKKFKNIDHVFHLAGKSYVPSSWKTPDKFLKTNIVGTIHACNFCRKNSSSLTFISSYVYGNTKCLRISEKRKVFASNPYALSKIISEQICAFYSLYFNIKITVVRPFNIFGPNQKTKYIIPKIISQLKKSKIVLGSISPKRDFLFISDFVDLLEKTIFQKKRFQIINAGSGKAVCVGDLCQLIQKIAKTKLPVIDGQSKRKNEIPRAVANPRLAIKTFNWFPKITLQQGIKKILKAEKYKSA